MRILVISCQAFSLIQFRMDMMKAFLSEGHEVVAAAPDCKAEYEKLFRDSNIQYHSIQLERNGYNIIKDIIGLLSILKMIKDVRPDLVFCYQAKAVIYGSLAAHIAGIKGIYVLIAGLGSIYRCNISSIKHEILKKILTIEYTYALKCAKSVFFQNTDDANVFLNKGIVDNDKIELLNGSGVNLEHFKPSPIPDENRFLFIGRLIRDKGLIEYLEAAKQIKMKFPETIFDVIGYYDTNPSALTEKELQPYFETGIANYLGKQDDVFPYLSRCYAYILPSYHEGTPKTVLEAMAVGRPIITTDAPGCRETVQHDVNGFLVPVRNVDELVKRIHFLIKHPDDAKRMGEASLQKVREKYDVQLVNKNLIRVMNINHADGGVSNVAI